jgi:hypothetical protein
MLAKEGRNQNSFSKSMTDISLLTQVVCSTDPTIPQLHHNHKLVFEKKMELKKESIGKLASEDKSALQLIMLAPERVCSVPHRYHQNNMKYVKKNQLHTNFRMA